MRPVPEILTTLVKQSEGFHHVVRWRPVPTAVPYVCPAGFWTRGYGVLCSKDAGQITEPDAAEELRLLLPKYMAEAIRMSPRLAVETDGRLTAITDFLFNLGSGRYAASTLRRRVNDAQWGMAKDEIRKWVWGGGKKLPGLVTRREIDASLL